MLLNRPSYVTFGRKHHSVERVVQVCAIRLLSYFVVVGVALSLAAPTAYATMIARYTGEITSTRLAEGSPFAVGDTFFGTYVFDETLPDSDPSAGDGLYALTDFELVTSGGYAVSGTPGRIVVQNGPAGESDSYAIIPSTLSGTLAGTRVIDSLGIFLFDDLGETLSSDALPTSATLNDLFEVTDFRSWGLSIKLFPSSSEDDSLVGGRLSSLTLAVIPEPSSAVMIGLGLVVLGRRRLNVRAPESPRPSRVRRRRS